VADLIRAYLAEVESTLRPNLEREEIQAVLVETETHLRERMAALEEIGVSAESAAREAIAAFGPAIPYARDMAKAQDETPKALNRPVVAVAASLGAFALLLFPISSLLVQVLPSTPFLTWMLLTAAVHPVAIGAASYRSRRTIPLPLAGVSVATGLAMWLVLSVVFLNLYPLGGTGYVPRWEIATVLNGAWAGDAWRAQNAEALRTALDRGVGYQLLANPDYFAVTTGLMLLASLSANLIGASLGRFSRRRRLRRPTHA
jgi:hypothetical protein